MCVLRGLAGGSKESSWRDPPRGLWEVTRPPVPPLHCNRLLVCESLSSTFDSSLYNSQGVSRTSLRCSAEIFFSASGALFCSCVFFFFPILPSPGRRTAGSYFS